MTIRLRGHHLLCLLGYRGMGYSRQYVDNMTRIYETLQRIPETPVTIAAGPDDLCAAFPPELPCHCEDANVCERDGAVLSRLGLRAGGCRPWAGILAAIRASVRPDDIGDWCATCPWRPLGVCAEGVAGVRAGDPLPSLPTRKRN